MVIGAFPIAKLGTLLIRQVSKPIANAAKERAKSSPFFRTYICMPPAQFYNWCEVKAKMWILNLGKPTVVPTLNETMAIELGANLLGEGIIFTIAAAILYMEYARQVRKETAKEQARLDEFNTLNYTIQELYFTTEKQDAQIRELLRTVSDLESQVVLKPWKRSEVKSPQPPEDNIYSPRGPLPVDNPHPESKSNSDGLIFQAVEYLQNDVRLKP